MMQNNILYTIICFYNRIFILTLFFFITSAAFTSSNHNNNNNLFHTSISEKPFKQYLSKRYYYSSPPDIPAIKIAPWPKLNIPNLIQIESMVNNPGKAIGLDVLGNVHFLSSKHTNENSIIIQSNIKPLLKIPNQEEEEEDQRQTKKNILLSTKVGVIGNYPKDDDDVNAADAIKKNNVNINILL